VVVAVLDGCQGVVDDLFVEGIVVAALGPSCSEAVAELFRLCQWVDVVKGAAFHAYHGDLVSIAELEVGNVVGLLGGRPRSIGLESGRLRVHVGFWIIG
jgi:hypothetical protein